MALRKNNQKDYEKFANPNIDVLGDPKKVVGENTDKVKMDKKGNPFALVMESTESGLAKGDTIRIPNNKFIQDGYLMGGDYETKKTGDKSFEITKQK